jgi:ribosomal protein L22
MLDELQKNTQEYKVFDSKQQQIFGNRLGVIINDVLSDSDKAYLYSKSPSNSINRPLEEYIHNLKTEYDQYKKTQKFNLLRETWEKASGSSTPATWSEEKSIPILCLFTDDVQTMREIFDLINARNVSAANGNRIENAIKTLRTDPLIKKINDADFCDATFKNFASGEYGLVLGDTGEIKKLLLDKLGKEVYNWFFQKIQIDRIIKTYAEDKYRKDYVQNVLSKIDGLEAQKAKSYLKDLIKNEPLVGIKIMKEGQG